MNRRTVLVTALSGVLLLGACGTTEPTPTGTDSGAAPTGGPVTFTDSRDKEIRLDAPATRIVALEWAEAEQLVTLGVMPAGVADVKGYGTWVTAAKLDPSVADVGTRAEPSVDSIVALQPDLVIARANRGAELVVQLEKYVPVLVTAGSDAGDNIGRMRTEFQTIATAVGRTDEATKVLADFDKAIADGKQKIADAGAAGQRFAIADGYQQGGSVAIRMFGKGALVSQIGVALGLENAWPGAGDPMWALDQTDVEGLTAIKDADVRFFYNASDGDDVFVSGLSGNPIWQSLGFVQQKKLHRMPDGIWTFGGPLSAIQYAEQLVAAYTS
ncbi:iron-siderophore ABC transporter substrate-binding protein [Polymorphospora rubra]|uniref:ABC transporter substrate-binding protein n=1 Tax=Polymorphospora rubra TaxID=338584 RepID=UPI0033F6948F